MDRNLRNFVGIGVLLVVGLLAASDLADRLPSGLQGIAALVLFVLYFWIPFSLIVKIIYKTAGIPTGTKKLGHRQAKEVNRLWLSWLITAPITAGVYGFLLNRDQWKGILVFIGVFLLLGSLSYLYTRQRIMGHPKEELFQ